MLSSTVHSLKDRFRDELLEAFTAWCGHEAALPLSGFLSFADSFDISAYLSAERVAEIFEQALGSAPRRNKGSISFEEFKEAVCLCALAVSAKQWQVEYTAEKRARYHYKRADAEKSHVAPSLEQAVEQLLEAVDFGNPTRFAKRLPPRPAPAATGGADTHSPLRLTEGAGGRASGKEARDSKEALGSLEARLQAHERQAHQLSPRSRFP